MRSELPLLSERTRRLPIRTELKNQGVLSKRVFSSMPWLERETRIDSPFCRPTSKLPAGSLKGLCIEATCPQSNNVTDVDPGSEVSRRASSPATPPVTRLPAVMNKACLSPAAIAVSLHREGEKAKISP